MHENEQFLKRLQTRSSNYNVFEWEHDRKEQIKKLRRISKYDLSISTYRRGRSKKRGKKFILSADHQDLTETALDSKDLRTKIWKESVRNGPNK
mmetsp:Transcript_6650/g.10688  ORF Transcript_6650/g.10688 Transcript_6650/m.10688 type:complete len:94 (-) Transcript_6650:1631-1912(-)